MKVSLCTITFRHHLLSLKEIAVWARANDFQGVELWGAHARNLARTPIWSADWLASFGLTVPMLSDYLPTDGDADLMRGRMEELCRLAQHWRAPKIRTFAGGRASRDVPADDRRALTGRLADLCVIAADHGLELIVETHPNTLADSLASTLRLIGEVGHPALGINFDVLHVWEGGDDPVAAHAALKPHIRHHHLKNVRSRADLGVFAPANVYAAAGRRDGMTPLFEGELDYTAVLGRIAGDPAAEASLEWFGGDCFDILARDRRALQDAVARPSARAASL
jgi:3-dehydroshikimate dehydratase